MTKLFVVEAGKTQTLESQYFDNEKILQDILERFPEVIALDDLGVSEPFLVIGREVATPAGYIDVLCIDGEGILTVIEAKLARNSQIRREVVGQVLEYVAQVSKWRSQEVIQVANQYFRSGNTNTDSNLLDLLKEPFEESQNQLDPYGIYDKIDDNLRKGKIKVVIASDTIPDTLRDTVSFINSFSNFDIFVMQVKSYMKDDLQIFAPTIYGLTRKVPTGTDREKTPWDEESFFNSASKLSQDKINAIKDLYEFSKTAEVKWGAGKTNGSFSYAVSLEGKKVSIFNVISTGTIYINFGSFKNINSDKLINFRRQLKKIPGLSFPELGQPGGQYPNFNISLLLNDESMSIFKSAVTMLTLP